ncbi:hypothetical protein TSOC_001802 [Tetrabaena socialis]|uniref:Rotatin N-terminal domain-containing protein n=1 Tax=Tetrabaena socialis TaxID=47790 RepID=A0A2J8AFV8_9CHLO|nr:hypothetical protein TSOC_001802 [Tetrabaena socialis]|eukprot:PNH11400.1 hypothetical protein TSOC_001802 [Tetrabaena socialis]
MGTQDDRALTTDKLVHPLAEVRRRAVQSIDFKLKHGLLVHEDLAKDRVALKNLLGCLQHGDNGIPTDAVVLMLLARAAAVPFAARQLLHCGAEHVFAHLMRSRPAELQDVIAAAMAAIHSAPALMGQGPSPNAYSQGAARDNSSVPAGAAHGSPFAFTPSKEHHVRHEAPGPSPRDWLLHPVALAQSDDHELFELSLRLKYLDEPRVTFPALLQLHASVLLDLPVEAVAARHNVVDHLLALLTSAAARPDVVAAAAASLLRIVVLLKRALLLATDPMYNSPGGGVGSEAEARAADDVGHDEAGPRLDGTDAPGERPLGRSGQRLLPQALPAPPSSGAGSHANRFTSGDDEPVNVTRLAYLIAIQAFHALKDPGRLFAVAPLLEELVPLLLLGPDGALAVGGEQERVKWAQLLQVLSQALLANLSIARAESPPIVQAYTRNGGATPLPPLLNAPAAAVLTLAARLLSALPSALWAPEVVPPALLDTLAAAARDEVLSALLPGVRAAALPLLRAMRPDVCTLLDVAAAGEQALAAADLLVRQVPLLREGALAPARWLQQLQLALPALHLPGQGALLEAVVQGLALACGARGSADASGASGSPGDAGGPGAGAAAAAWSLQSEGLLMSLLAHPRSEVALACYALLEELVREVGAQPGHPLPRMLVHQVVLDGGQRDDLVVPAANPRLARSFRPADVANLLAITANAALAPELRRSACEQMLALAAEERLRECLQEEASLRVIARVVSSALRYPTTAASLTASQASALAEAGLPPPQPDSLSCLDVQLPVAALNLLFVLASHSARVRAWLVRDEAPPGASPTQPCDGGAWAEMGAGGAPGVGGSGGEEVGGGLGMLVEGVLALAFHPMVTVRRSVARLFAAVCFGGEADRWSGWAALEGAAGAAGGQGDAPGVRRAAGGTGSAGDVLRLPAPFQRSYCFPCRVTWLGLPAVVARPSEQARGLEGKPQLQDVVSEQRELVVLVVQERQALRAAGGDTARLLALMNEQPDRLGMLPPAAVHTLAANIRAVAPAVLVSRCLAAVSASASHAECSAALRGLQTACSTRQGVAALAAGGWQVHLEQLLSCSPASPEDRALWRELLGPIQRAVVSGAMNEPQLLQLALYLQQSTGQLLSPPDAMTDPPTVPVALAGSAMLPDHTAQHAHIACTLDVLATLVELVRCARERLTLRQALRVLSALSPTALLNTLATAYIGNTAANYGCRVLAIQLLHEATALLAAVRAAGADEPPPLDPGLGEALRTCLHSLLGNVSGGFAATAASAQRLTGGGGGPAVAAVAAERARERQAGGFAGKAAVRLAMHCLLHVTALLPPQDWTSSWQQLSGSFWVSRLMRDRDGVQRTLAVEVLARLLQPGADGTQGMVAQGWPDAVKMMARAATDRGNCFALRAAALRALCACMAQDAQPGAPTQAASEAGGSGPAATPASELPLPRRQLFSSRTSLPPAASLLRDDALWAGLAALLRDPAAPAPCLAAGLALLLQALLLEGKRSAGLLRQLGLMGRLLQMLDVAAALQQTGGEAEGWSRTGAGRGAVLAVLGAEAGGRGGAGRGDGRGAAEGGAVEGAAAAEQGAAGWADVTADVQLERAVGLDAGAGPGAAPLPAADPSQLHQHLCALRCAGLVAALVAHTQQEPALLQLHLIGHAPADVARALLAAFVRLAAGVATLEGASRGSWLHSRGMHAAALGAARLEAVRQCAVASTALLQALTEQEAQQLLGPLDAALSRGSGPLLPHCAEVLLAGCSPQPLRLAVVCLVASLLAHGGTAAQLLHFPGTDGEYLVGSTGREVGAGLFAALAALLPDDALDCAPSAPTDAAPWPRSPAGGGSSTLRGSTAAFSPRLLSGRGVGGGVEPPGRTGASPAGLGASELCVIVAMRNLLAHSAGAKQAATRAGYHRLLFRCCAGGAVALAEATVAPQGAGCGERKGGEAAVGGAPSPAKSTSSRAAPPAASTGAGGRASAATAASRGRASHRRPAASGAPAGLRQREQAAAAELAAAEGLAAEATPASPATVAPSPVRSQAQGGGAAAPSAAAERKLAARRLLEQKVVASLSLLKHLAHGSTAARQVLARDGAVAALRSLWPPASAATSGPLFHELLGCAANLLPGCAEARLQLAQEGARAEAGGPAAGGAGTLLGSLLACLWGPSPAAQAPRLEATTFGLLVGVLLQLSSAEDGAALLIRSPFLPACHAALHDMANSAGGGRAGAGGGRLGRDLPRQAALLQLLAALAAWPDGQRALLKSCSAPGLLELVVRLIAPGHDGALPAPAPSGPSAPATAGRLPSHSQQQQQHPQQHAQGAAAALAALRNSALALLRNLCFAAEAKSHLLAHPALLPALVAASEAVADNPQGAALAASGLWSLSYHGEKVKAALRRVPSAPQRLVAALATCRFQESRAAARAQEQEQGRSRAAQQQQQQGEAQGGGLPGHGEALGAGAQQEQLLWLQRAGAQLAGLMEALQAATGPVHGEGGGGPDVLVCTPWPPDRSPQRDQS